MRFPDRDICQRLLVFCLTTIVIGEISTRAAYFLQLSAHFASPHMTLMSKSQASKSWLFECTSTGRAVVSQQARHRLVLADNSSLKSSHKDLNLGLWLGGTLVFILSILSGIGFRYLVIEPVKRDFYRELSCLTVAASHQLRNSLTAVSVSAEVMASRLQQLDHSKKTEILTIIEATRQLARLSEDLLFLIRSESSAGNAQTISFPIYEVLEDLVDRFELEAQERCITFSMNLPTNVTVCGDPNQISQLFLSLLETIFEHTKPHEKVVLLLKQEKTFAVVHLRNADERVKVRSPRSFLAWRCPSQKTEPQEDVRLGLHFLTAQAIAQCHGGNLTVERCDDSNYSSFRVALPIAELPAG